MRIMGLDFGSKTVGVAISDELLLTAQGIEIVRRKDENKLRQTLARIEELIVEYGVEEIVLGLPKNMNATEGIRVELTNEFKEKLERRTGLTVHTWDERLTTVAADKAMIEAGIRREKRKAGGDLLSSFVSEREGRINPPFLTENLIQITVYLNQIQTWSRSSPHIS